VPVSGPGEGRAFRPRPGRIGDRGSADSRAFVGQVRAAARKAGLTTGGVGLTVGRSASVFGRGRTASLDALRRVGGRARRATVKARVVRQAAGAPLKLHLQYLQREGVDRAGAPGRLFDANGEGADGRAFAARCADDRHHFRFIVAPEDAAELEDLRTYARELMAQAERDLRTRLDWVAVDHWNTAHPHVHVLVRGVAEDGRDLVISRDYIAQGLRARASDLASLELGPRTDREIRQSLAAEVDAERWTRLDRALARDASESGGVIDLRRPLLDPGDELRRLKLARLAKLERLGLAEPAGRSRWRLSSEAEPTLKDLARRGDIIARLNRALADQALDRGAETWRLEPDAAQPIVGRLIGRGLDDELKGSAFAIVDGVDGRVHHFALPSLEAAGDAELGAIVETRQLPAERGRVTVLAVRSDLSLGQQVSADGATWLDRQLVGRGRAELADTGFGAEVHAALDRRAEHLIAIGLARREASGVRFVPGLIETLRRRELEAAAAKLAAETGLARHAVAEGETIAGVVRRRVILASGRFAMIDDGLGFSLVPWRAELQRHLGRQVAGVMGPGGALDLTRGRGVGR
jgi:type IV secretory pathway VirD2 relaxase